MKNLADRFSDFSDTPWCNFMNKKGKKALEKRKGVVLLKLEEKTVKQEILYQGKIINLRKDLALLENGNTAVREIVEHSGGVCVAALTEQNELLFVRQFRYPYQKVLLELPAGKRNPGEDPLAWRQAGAEGRNRRRGKRLLLLGRTLSYARLLRRDHIPVWVPGGQNGTDKSGRR